MRLTFPRARIVITLTMASSVWAAEHSTPLVAGPAPSPKIALQGYTQAMKSGDWLAAARLMHPEALAQIKSLVDQLASMDPTGQVAHDMLKLGEGQTVESITPEEAFARVMDMLATASPPMFEVFQTSTVTFLGTVREGEYAHIVYRRHAVVQGSAMRRIEVLTTKRDGRNWRVLLLGDMENAVAGIMKMLAMKRGA